MAGQQSEKAGDLALLVPFYVNGTLPPEGQARIEAALPGDPDLRAELEAARQAAQLVKHGGAELTAKAAAPYRAGTLLARIQPAARRYRTGIGVFWRPALAACAAVLVVQAGLVLWQTRQGRYETLSGPAVVQPQAQGRLLVRLSPDARWSQVEALLSSRELEIVGGPRDSEVEVAIPAGGKVDEEVRRLRASPLVEFAGPVS